MNTLPQLYDNSTLWCCEWHSAVTAKNEALANVFEQMAEHTQERIEQHKASRKAGGKRTGAG